MEATQVNPTKFGNEFEDSVKINAGDVFEVTAIDFFTSKEGYEGVSLTTEQGARQKLASGKYHTTAKQPLGYIKSDKMDLQGLIKSADDGRISLYFYSEKPENSKFNTMLKCSIYPQR